MHSPRIVARHKNWTCWTLLTSVTSQRGRYRVHGLSTACAWKHWNHADQEGHRDGSSRNVMKSTQLEMQRVSIFNAEIRRDGEVGAEDQGVDLDCSESSHYT